MEEKRNLSHQHDETCDGKMCRKDTLKDLTAQVAGCLQFDA
jgi:hypothetical protein